MEFWVLKPAHWNLAMKRCFKLLKIFVFLPQQLDKCTYVLENIANKLRLRHWSLAIKLSSCVWGSRIKALPEIIKNTGQNSEIHGVYFSHLCHYKLWKELQFCTLLFKVAPFSLFSSFSQILHHTQHIKNIPWICYTRVKNVNIWKHPSPPCIWYIIYAQEQLQTEPFKLHRSNYHVTLQFLEFRRAMSIS